MLPAMSRGSFYNLLPLLLLMMLVSCSQGAISPAVRTAADIEDSTAVAPTPATPSGNSSNTLQKMTYQLGPFDLPAGAKASAMRENPARITFSVDEPMWITTFVPQVEDADGNTLPSSLLHLAIISNDSENNPLCGDQQSGSPIAAATSSLEKIELPKGFGYAVLPEDQLEATVVLQNPRDEDYHTVYFKFTLIGEPMRVSKLTRDVFPMMLDADPCGHKPSAIEPSGYTKQQQRFTVPESGKLVAAYGLLQDYGIGLDLTRESEGKPFWSVAAKINQQHNVISIPSFVDPDGVAFNAGDGLLMTVSYQNFSDRWFNDATNAAMVYLARTNTNPTPSASKPFPEKVSQAATQVQSTLLQ